MIYAADHVRIDRQAPAAALDDACNEFAEPERWVSEDPFYGVAVMAGQIRYTVGMHMERSNPFQIRPSLQKPLVFAIQVVRIRLVKDGRMNCVESRPHGGEHRKS